MGLFRRKREEAPPAGSGIQSFEGGKVPWASDRESIGRPVQGQAQGADLAALGVPTAGIAGAYLKAMGLDEVLEQATQAQAGIRLDVTQSSQTLDASNSELGEKLTEIMRRHGMDPSGATVSADPARMAAMQQEMMEALGQAGTLDPGPPPGSDS